MENKAQELKKEIDNQLQKFFKSHNKTYLSSPTRSGIYIDSRLPLGHELEAEWRGNDKEASVYTELVRQVTDLTLRGGDRMRPILVYFGYKSILNPINKIFDQELLQFSLCVELFHTAALIHDDIMDNAEFRRGGLTVHKYFEKKYSKDLARNLAILAGDLALIWTDQIYWSAKIDKEILLKAKKYFDLLREEVIFGQTMDLILPYLSLRAKRSNLKSDEIATSPRQPAGFLAMTEEAKQILKTYTYKTAKYSLERPLHLGASLAGASPNTLKSLTNYAIPVGIAFQIQDDILGVFGKKTGKDVDSDIKEGKKTLLIYYSKQKAVNSKEKNKLDSILRNKNASKKDIALVRNFIKETGALKTCQEQAKKLVQQGKRALINTSITQQAKNFLFWLADFSISRSV